ncbi:putative START domain [Monocercomonoides exilis]|uniref:putative START domain n=1 Tax=Monocercomonoides exilis TaxID=2049356 RepID=UPI00355A62F3|nr:putative START domain [Monocercomonoides exilis]|eukprot:MONOS_1037.1-p1 / transcript=MONOS_1037.1 / gene=MONOS_1037 / organism=Monocercomonoides_exilis_PA203 / gene_product=unspecified product / transcript_product=unspecified product / location=Mono_scaffold00017:180374-182211(+) / protein_length=371 / sequence_SO=supercontig / SO=protein_coding / is_pseudo=false
MLVKQPGADLDNIEILLQILIKFAFSNLHDPSCFEQGCAEALSCRTIEERFWASSVILACILARSLRIAESCCSNDMSILFSACWRLEYSSSTLFLKVWTRSVLHQSPSRGHNCQIIFEFNNLIITIQKVPSEADRAEADRVWEHLHQIYKNQNSAEWTSVKKSKEFNLYSRVSKSDKIPSEFRLDGILNYPIAYVLTVLDQWRERAHWDKTTAEYTEFWSDGHGLSMSYNQVKPQGAGLISPRDFITLQLHKTTDDGCHIYAGSSCECHSIPEKKGIIRGWCYPSGWIVFTERDTEKDIEITKMIYTVCTDLKGSLPQWVINKAYSSTLGAWFDQFKGEVERIKSQDTSSSSTPEEDASDASLSSSTSPS